MVFQYYYFYYLTDRVEMEEIMNILICSCACIFEPHLIDAFKQLHINVKRLDKTINNTYNDPDYIKELSDELKADKYDFVFSLNYLPIVSMVCSIFKIKYISWVLDSPCFELNSHTLVNQINYIFIFDRELYNSYKDKLRGHIFYLPLSANTQFIDSITLTEEELTKYSCDISFVGSTYASRRKYYSIKLSDYWKGYFDALINIQLSLYGINIFENAVTQDALCAVAKSLNWDLSFNADKTNSLYEVDFKRLLIDNYLCKECSYLERINIIDKLSRHFKFHVYTFDDISEYTNVFKHDSIDPCIDVFKVYKSSKININITSKSIKTGLPLRIFDILGAGGFLITNYQSELPEMFEIGKDLVIYESIEDLIDKTAYYLEHDDERKIIAENGYKKVKSSYQTSSRILEFFSRVI